jgi:Brp/Blh family beta-carotene 15,15'-monooxygenase
MGSGEWLVWGPLVVSLVVFGLPHGAVDHLEIADLWEKPVTSGPVLGALVGYVLVAAVVIGLWMVAPAVAFLAFILMTWVHWGQGDVWFVPASGTDPSWPTLHRVSLAAVRGGLPMLGPLAWHVGEFRRIFEVTAGAFGAAVPSAATWGFLSDGALVGLVALLVGHAALRLRAGWSRSTGIDLVDTLTLVAFFRVVPAIFAVGLYFCLWHGARHILRLADRRTPSPAVPWRAIGQTLRQSVPLTLVSIAGIVGLGFWLVAGTGATGLGAWVGWYLVVIAGLTVPHLVVVFGMDRRDRVWS